MIVSRQKASLFPIALYVVLLVVLVSIDRGPQPWVLAASAGQGTDKLNDPQFIAEGGRLFGPSCGNAYCHGIGGIGGGAPKLRGKGLDAAYLFKTISNGIPGTAMLPFKSELSEDRIWKLVAFILSDAKGDAQVYSAIPEKTGTSSVTGPLKPADAKAVSTLNGDIQSGKALFFDSAQSKSCHHCHTFGGDGTMIGPDLSKVGNKPAKELFLRMVIGGEIKDMRYSTIRLTLKSGDKVTGVKKEEDAESIRIYDTTELPAVLRTVQLTDISKSETYSESIMPKDYASIYTVKQLLDLVSYLKSLDSKSPVTLKDLF